MACKGSGVQIPSAPPPPKPQVNRHVRVSASTAHRLARLTTVSTLSATRVGGGLGQRLAGALRDLEHDVKAALKGGHDTRGHLRRGLAVHVADSGATGGSPRAAVAPAGAGEH